MDKPFDDFGSLLDSILDDRPPEQSASAARYAQTCAVTLLLGMLAETLLAVGDDGPLAVRQVIGRRTVELFKWTKANRGLFHPED
ncbi:MAG TPA: hypothetical protein VGH74_07710 [Planctomycetaceae bacterium]